MKFFLAGGDSIAGNNTMSSFCEKYSVGRLHSSLHEKRQINKWNYKTELMVDSGAHTWNKLSINKVGMKSARKIPNLKDHAENYLFLYENHKDKPFIFIELDCYANLTRDYINEMYKTVKAMKGKAKYLRVYHPFIDGGSMKVLKSWMDAGEDYIGIGREAIPIFDKIFNLTRDKIKFHCFAMTARNILDQYPIYSVDSTTVLCTRIYGGTIINGGFVGKDRLIREKNIGVVQSHRTRMEKGVKEFKKLQNHYTELWKKRGVIWEN